MGYPFVLLLFGVSIFNGLLALPTNYDQADNKIYKGDHCVVMTPEKEEEVNSIVVKLSEYLYNLTLEYDDLDIRLVKIIVESHSENEVEEKDTEVQLVVNDCAYIDDVIESVDGVARIVHDGRDQAVKLSEQADDKKTDAPESVESNSEEAESQVTKDKSSESETFACDSESDMNDVTSNQSEEKSESSSETKSTAVENVDNNSKTKKIKSSISETKKSPESKGIFETVFIVDSDEVEKDPPVDYIAKAPQVMMLDLDEQGNKLVEMYEKKHGNVPLLLYVRKVLDDLQYLFLN